jgi:DNA-binding MarR family transcriptional regulator
MVETPRAAPPGRACPAHDLGIVDGLVQLSAIVQAVLSRVTAGADLSVQQGRLLSILRDREPSMAQLARLLDLDKSSTTGLVDRATQRGPVRRFADPEDGRRLTEVLGNEVAREVAALTDGLSDTNRHRLSLLAGRVIADAAVARGIGLSA